VKLILEKEAALGTPDAWQFADKIRASFGGQTLSDSSDLVRAGRRGLALSSLELILKAGHGAPVRVRAVLVPDEHARS